MSLAPAAALTYARPPPPPSPPPPQCRAYLDCMQRGGGAGPRPLLAPSFSEWAGERRELKFLLGQLALE